MKIWRGLRTRIIFASILCGLLGLVVSWALIRRTARDAMQSGFAPYVRRTLDGGEMQRCELSPERWSLELARGARLDAYEEGTLRSANPNAPPLDPALYQRLEAGEPNPLKFYRFEGEHVAAMLLRTAQRGPCALVQVTWPPHPARSRRFSNLVLTGTVVVIAMAAALGVFLVVQPLTRRIGKLRAAAAEVGSRTGYVSAGDLGSDELGELSSGLDRAHARIRADAEQLLERQRALERSLGDVAHDLKTPIASLQIALERASKLNHSEDVAEMLKSSLRDVVYLSGLTTNLRIACQLREGWNPADGDPSVDLTDTVERVVARSLYFAKNRGIALDVARPDTAVLARCHPTAAEQAITNLVENAIAYGDSGGHVAVVLEIREGGFSLTVADDGPGVPPALLPRLGERTFRSDDARQRDPSGSGLGLAITSEICARCGWTLSFEAHEPRGLRVAIGGPTISPPAQA
ncbi:MAG TPA: HAMP domain-containing sensor histidine kinase [Polyangiaceae bacterium]|nr:HAMP domain-containing sensor histidine kinase [Polyangiaceae bacterium]